MTKLLDMELYEIKGIKPCIKFTEKNTGNSMYLTPFRLTQFQLSRDEDEQVACASSKPIGLSNIIDSVVGFNSNRNCDGYLWGTYDGPLIKELLMGQLMICLTSEPSCNFVVDNMAEVKRDVLSRFIYMCIEYIDNL